MKHVDSRVFCAEFVENRSRPVRGVVVDEEQVSLGAAFKQPMREDPNVVTLV